MLSLTRPTRPPLELEAQGQGGLSIYSHRRLVNHPCFCHVCCNFDTQIIGTLVGLRKDVLTDEGCSAISAQLIEVAEAANNGCPSCFILHACISNVFPTLVNFDDATLGIKLAFLEGSVLRGTISYLSEDGEDDGAMCFEEHGLPSNLSLQLELYTLPGKREHGQSHYYHEKCTAQQLHGLSRSLFRLLPTHKTDPA